LAFGSEDGGASHGRFVESQLLSIRRQDPVTFSTSQTSRDNNPLFRIFVFRDLLLVSPSLAFSRSARFPWFLVTEFCHQLSLLFLFMSPVSCFWMLNHARLLPWILRDKGLFPAGSASAVIDR
jgi:hypothetical protein